MPRQRRCRIALSEAEQKAIGRAIANPPSDRVRKRAEALLGLRGGERIADICRRVGVGRVEHDPLGAERQAWAGIP